MHLIGEYIKYKLNSKGKHDIHSPFVFDFVTKCLKLELANSKKNKLKELKKSLSKDKRILEIKDFGAGSKKLGSKRSVRQIYKNATSKGIYAELLFQLVKHYDLKNVLELGTSLGVGSAYLAFGSENVNVISIDACSETQKIAHENFSKLGLNNINLINDNFSNFISNLNNEKFDLVFIDGHHDGFALKNYIALLEKHTNDETIFVLDDIRWNKDMLNAWNEVCDSEKFHLTLDLFRMGIVLKRTHQAKEHFVIKLKGVIKGMI